MDRGLWRAGDGDEVQQRRLHSLLMVAGSERTRGTGTRGSARAGAAALVAPTSEETEGKWVKFWIWLVLCGWLDVDSEEDLERGWRQKKWMDGTTLLKIRVSFYIYVVGLGLGGIRSVRS